MAALFGGGRIAPLRSATPGRSGTGRHYELADNYRQLAAAILHRGLRDYWLASLGQAQLAHRELAEMLGYGDDAEAEVVAFFESDWLDHLCAACDLNVEDYLAAARRRPEERGEYNAQRGY